MPYISCRLMTVDVCELEVVMVKCQMLNGFLKNYNGIGW